jgi:hypothetical protein
MLVGFAVYSSAGNVADAKREARVIVFLAWSVEQYFASSW